MGVLDLFKSGSTLSNGNEWRWKFTDSGIYSVKSGYEMARKWKMDTQTLCGEVSDWQHIVQIWGKFWKILVPNRVKLVT